MPQIPDAFYVPHAGTTDEFTPTTYCIGPWSKNFQHAGPPSALLARSMEALAAASGLPHVARFTVQVSKPVPMSLLKVVASISHGGKSVAHIAGVLSAGGTVVARAAAVFMRQSSTPMKALQNAAQKPLAPPPRGKPYEFPDYSRVPVGYRTAMQLEISSGVHTNGPTTMWFRQRVPLVLGEPAPSGLQRLLVVGDSGNGISFYVSPLDYSFVNPDFSVVIHRPPRGEWIAMEARTELNDEGSGAAYSKLFDEEGHCGDGSQTLFVNKL